MRGEWLVKQYGGATPDVVVFGSSHGMMWAKVIDEVAEELGLTISFFTARATPPLIEFPVEKKATSVFTADEKKLYDETRLERIKEWSPKVVILIDRWSYRENISEYNEMVQYIEACGSQVLFFEQPPEVQVGDYSVPMFVAYQTSQQENLDAQTHMHQYRAEEVVSANERLVSLAMLSDSTHVMPLYDLFLTGDGEVKVRAGGEIFYIDEDHLSYAGALLGKSRIQSIIEALIERSAESL